MYRQFTRIGAEKVPDAKTLGRLVQALGPAVIQPVHPRRVAIAQEKKVVRGTQASPGYDGRGKKETFTTQRAAVCSALARGY